MSFHRTPPFPNRAAMDRFAREFRRDALPVLAVSQALPGTRIPLVWVGAERRPDVGDLVCRHQTDGEGDVFARWRCLLSPTLDEGDAVLEVEATRPLATRFAVRFAVEEHWAALADILASGKVAVTTVRPDLPNRRLGEHLGLVLDCDPDGLEEPLKLFAAAVTARGLGLL